MAPQPVPRPPTWQTWHANPGVPDGTPADPSTTDVADPGGYSAGSFDHRCGEPWLSMIPGDAAQTPDGAALPMEVAFARYRDRPGANLTRGVGRARGREDTRWCPPWYLESTAGRRLPLQQTLFNRGGPSGPTSVWCGGQRSQQLDPAHPKPQGRRRAQPGERRCDCHPMAVCPTGARRAGGGHPGGTDPQAGSGVPLGEKLTQKKPEREAKRKPLGEKKTGWKDRPSDRRTDTQPNPTVRALRGRSA